MNRLEILIGYLSQTSASRQRDRRQLSRAAKYLIFLSQISKISNNTGNMSGVG